MKLPYLNKLFTSAGLSRPENYSGKQLETALRSADKKNDIKLAKIFANEIRRRREIAKSVATKRPRNDMWLERKEAEKELEIAGTVAISVPAALLAWVFKGFRQGQDNASP